MLLVSKFNKQTRRKNERGAALITTLLMSSLLLTAGGALILTTAMSVTNTYDTTSENQAYYAAEAGLQATLNVLRGNVSPNISYRSAITPSTSNAAGDPATSSATPFARLSKWLAYDGTFNDRVPLTTPYSPLTGSAFNAVLSDPDNSALVSYTTRGAFDNGTATKTFTTGSNSATITFQPASVSAFNAYPTGASNLGTFVITLNGGSAQVPAGTTFTLTITQTAPWTASVTINCTLEGLASNTANTVAITFPALSYSGNGVLYTLPSNPQALNAPPAGGKLINVTLTAPQPRRVLVRVNGYGPRGARKQMEMMVGRFVFDYWPKGLIAIRSADDNVSTMTFNSGSSAVYSYSGNPSTSGQSIAAFAVTSTVDYNLISGLSASGRVSGNPAALKVPITDLVSWLQTADEARRTLNKLEATAKAQNRYFTNASLPSDYGTAASPKFTFIDGDATLEGGHGLLVCTGTVTLNGNDEFKGLMIVMGTGRIIRDGGGNGASLGAFALARFDRNTWGAPFLAPSFQANGSGTSSITYDPTWVERALVTGSRYTIGISEY